jgi:Fe-S-cluster containining protein
MLDNFTISSNEKFEINNFNNPECKNCNECCSNVIPISIDEYNKIKFYLKTKEGKEILHKIKSKKIPLAQNVEVNYCKFSYNMKCLIYDIRPNICRYFHCDEKLRNDNEMQRKFKNVKYIYFLSDLYKEMIEK